MEAAYIAAVIPLMKKAPKLKDLLIEVEEKGAAKGPKPWEQQLAAVRQIMESKRK